MNAAEHIVKLWLESQNFFVLGPLHADGNFEVDLLAIKLNAEATGIVQKVHAEVTVSGRPAGPMESPEQYVQKKLQLVTTLLASA
jgi:hypothetical protein